jgi:hypothetical protein
MTNVEKGILIFAGIVIITYGYIRVREIKEKIENII